MILLFVSRLSLWSGQTKKAGAPSFARTVDAYLKEGHTVHLITTQRRACIEPQEGFHLHPVLHRLRISGRLRIIVEGIFFPFAALWTYLRLARQVDFDLIYGYEVHGILAGYLINLLAKRPFVSRFQGTVLKPIMQSGSFGARAKRFDHFLAFKVPADLAIMTDDGTFGNLVLQQLNPSLASRSVFWRNGVDRPGTAVGEVRNVRKDLGISDSTTILMTLSRLARWKRVDRAIRAMPLILEGTRDVVLIVVGDGTEKPQLEQLTHELGVERQVVFTGAVEHARVHDYLQAADVFLSLYDLSNLGNPLMEALLCGKAVVTIAHGDTGAMIQHGVNGILLDTGDPVSVAAAVLELIRDRARRDELGRNAGAYAEQHFWEWDTRMAQELRVVRDLVNSAVRRGRG